MNRNEANTQLLSLIDPANFTNIAAYIQNGLTYVSNNDAVHTRDDAGNIILKENSDSNQLLIIEPTVKRVSTKSVIKVVNTAFQYYKFPVSVRTNDILPELDLNIDSLSNLSNNFNQTLIIPITYDSKGQPETLNRISTTFESGWYYNLVGVPDLDPSQFAVGYRELPFTGGDQPRQNAYTIDQTLIDILQQETKTLKFTVQVQFTSQNSTDVQYKLLLQRSNQKSYRPKNVEFQITTNWDTNIYPIIRFEYVLDINDIIDTDRYIISAVSDDASWILSESCYWDIELIDRPTPSGVIEVNSNDGVTILQQ